MKDRTTTKQRGSSAVEFALVLPLLLFIVFGIIDFGWLFFTDLQVTNAARDGARVGAAADKGSVVSMATTRVPQALDASGLDSGKATVSVNCDDANLILQVQVTYTFVPLVGLGSLPFIGTMIMPPKVQSTATFHIDNGQGC